MLDKRTALLPLVLAPARRAALSAGSLGGKTDVDISQEVDAETLLKRRSRAGGARICVAVPFHTE